MHFLGPFRKYFAAVTELKITPRMKNFVFGTDNLKASVFHSSIILIFINVHIVRTFLRQVNTRIRIVYKYVNISVSESLSISTSE
jgi:catabolite regulation protein CreA